MVCIELKLQLLQTLEELEVSLEDEETGVNKVRQKLLFDLDTVQEVIS